MVSNVQARQVMYFYMALPVICHP